MTTNRHGVSCWGDKNVLNLDFSDGCTTQWTYKKPMNGILLMGELFLNSERAKRKFMYVSLNLVFFEFILFQILSITAKAKKLSQQRCHFAISYSSPQLPLSLLPYINDLIWHCKFCGQVILK